VTAASSVLLPQHELLLRHSSISSDVASARGYRSVTIKAELERLGFSKQQARTPALLIPIWGTTGEIVLYQSRPDEPRILRGKSIKYETPRGARMVLDIPPRVREWLGDPSRPLFITEGVRKADAAVSMDLCCIDILGVWNFRGTNELGGKTVLGDWEYIAFNDRPTYLAFDSDVMTKPEVHAALVRLKAFLETRGARVMLIYLPSGSGGEKVGLDDFLASGHGIEDLLSLASPIVQPAPACSSSENSLAPFRIEAGRICYEKDTRDGTVVTPLCNFVARVVEEVELDDGQETSRAFSIEGSLDTGQPLPLVRIPVDRFCAMGWTTGAWGLRAVVRAGLSTKDLLREAIQRLSTDAKRRRVFTHTGWRNIEGRWVYLTASGAIGVDGFEIDLGPELSRYRFPRTTEDPVVAMRASLRLLDMAKLTITAPLWAGVFRAPLASAYPLDLSLWMEGQTGTLKSSQAAAALSHWGQFDRTNLPGAWSSTANSLEKRAFSLKDSLFVVDDYAPTGPDRREFEVKAARLLRAQGNLAGRGRLRADLTERPGYPPRGLILGTGEQRPPGRSILARMFLIEVCEGDVCLDVLSAVQKDALRLPHAMAGYISWLGPQMDSLPTTLGDQFRSARARAEKSGPHLRIPEALAHLWLGIDAGLGYAEEIKACDAIEAGDIRARCWEALVERAKIQGRLVEEEKPTHLFLRILNTLLVQKRAVLLAKDSSSEGLRAEIPLLGWQDDDYLYLLPDAAFQAVARFARDAGDAFPIREYRLRQDLIQAGFAKADPNHTTSPVRVGGALRRVICLRRAAISAVLGEEPSVPLPAVTDVTGSEE